MKTAVMFVSAMLVVFTANALEQSDWAPRVRIGAHVGYVSGGDIEEESAAGGVHMELSLTDFIGLEASASGFTEDAEDDPIYDAQLAIASGGASVVLKFNSGPVTLFGLGGVNYNVGAIEIVEDIGVSVTEVDYDFNDVGYHVGGGVRARMGDRLEFFAEYRYTFLEIETDEGEGTLTTFLGMEFDVMADPEEFDYSFGMAKAGINFLF